MLASEPVGGRSRATEVPCLIVSPVRSTYGGYYGLVVVTPPRPQTLHRSHDNLKILIGLLPYFYM